MTLMETTMQWLMHLIDYLRNEYRRHDAVRQLRKMSPQRLRDIGIEPHRIDAAIEGMLKADSKGNPPARPPVERERSEQGPVRTPDAVACC